MNKPSASPAPASAEEVHPLPGSKGEHRLQRLHGTERRARAFYQRQMLDRLNERMQEFISAREMMFVSTADADGNCDCSIRTGPPGFVCVADERTLLYPEYRGNGVMASVGNLSENAHIGLLFVDFFGSTVGCHVNGAAWVVENRDLPELFSGFAPETRAVVVAALAPSDRGRQPERWVVVSVEEAFIHCSKHIPRLRPGDKAIPWGTDDPVAKGGDHFEVKNLSRPWNDGETKL